VRLRCYQGKPGKLENRTVKYKDCGASFRVVWSGCYARRCKDNPKHVLGDTPTEEWRRATGAGTGKATRRGGESG